MNFSKNFPPMYILEVRTLPWLLEPLTATASPANRRYTNSASAPLGKQYRYTVLDGVEGIERYQKRGTIPSILKTLSTVEDIILIHKRGSAGSSKV